MAAPSIYSVPYLWDSLSTSAAGAGGAASFNSYISTTCKLFLTVINGHTILTRADSKSNEVLDVAKNNKPAPKNSKSKTPDAELSAVQGTLVLRLVTALAGIIALVCTLVFGPLSPTKIFTDDSFRYGCTEPVEFSFNDLKSKKNQQLMYADSVCDTTQSFSLCNFVALSCDNDNAEQTINIQFTDTVFGFSSIHDSLAFSNNSDQRYFFQQSKAMQGFHLYSASFIKRECTEPILSENPNLSKSFSFTDKAAFELYRGNKMRLGALYGVAVLGLGIASILLIRYVYKIVR